MRQRVPRRLGPAGGPLHHMCANSTAANRHHAQVDSRPPRCLRHYELYQQHLDANRGRRAAGRPEVEEFDPGPDAPEDSGSLLLGQDDTDFLHSNLLNRVTRARLALLEGRDHPRRHAEAVETLDAVCRELLKFFDEVGLSRVVDQRPRR